MSWFVCIACRLPLFSHFNSNNRHWFLQFTHICKFSFQRINTPNGVWLWKYCLDSSATAAAAATATATGLLNLFRSNIKHAVIVADASRQYRAYVHAANSGAWSCLNYVYLTRSLGAFYMYCDYFCNNWILMIIAKSQLGSYGSYLPGAAVISAS